MKEYKENINYNIVHYNFKYRLVLTYSLNIEKYFINSFHGLYYKNNIYFMKVKGYYNIGEKYSHWEDSTIYKYYL